MALSEYRRGEVTMGTEKPSHRFLFLVHLAAKTAVLLVLAGFCREIFAQTTVTGDLAPVTISAKANPDPVEKSYRKMIRGMDLFAKQRAISPDASLRFKLLPRRNDIDMTHIEMGIVGSNAVLPVRVERDNTFVLERDLQAFNEDAQVTPNRKSQSMTWRIDIRTPGLPPNTRRLGDLRLECKVGMESGLVSNRRTLVGRVVNALLDTPAYCDRKEPLYLFFADQPLFSVTLIDKQRREVQSIDKLYAAASDDPGLPDELPYCDCEVLVDRTYTLPLGDRSWPDDTLVVFEYMDAE